MRTRDACTQPTHTSGHAPTSPADTRIRGMDMYARTMADVGVAAHAHRNYRCNGEQRPGMFTRGNRNWLGERDKRPEMLVRLDSEQCLRPVDGQGGVVPSRSS